MATVALKSNHVQHSVLQSQWTVGSGDVGVPDQLSRYPNHSVQMTGTFGGATVLLQGSDDGITWFTLHDVSGADISRTSDGRFDTIAIVPQHVRPSSSSGSGVNVKVIVTSRSFGR